MPIRCPICDRPIEVDYSAATAEAGGEQRTPQIANLICPNCGLVQLPDERQETETLPSISSGRAVAHFTLIRLLGRGGFGQVWLADDDVLHRSVALKLPISRGGEAIDLLREARTAAKLKHPNIVAVYEVGKEDDQVFIASEYIAGMTLRDLLSAGTPSIGKTAVLVADVARALHYAHTQGIVHRDVKPGNIIMDGAGRPFVTDFGIAKRVAEEETISSQGQVLGTARYMSPEQASGNTRGTDHRADIYALGVVLFQMLTGHCPFRGNMRALLFQKVHEDPPSPRRLNPTLPRDLETICLKCLERDPNKRYGTAGELADELDRFRTGEPIQARPISSLERGWRWCRRRPTVSGLVAGLFLSLSVGLIGISFFYWQAARSAATTRQSLYRSSMNLVSEYVAKGDILGVKQTLGRIAGDDRMARLRGFEWYYHDALIAPFVRVVSQGDAVTDVAVSRDGRYFAAIGNDRDVRIWRKEQDRLVRTLSAATGRPRAIACCPTHDVIAVGASDGWLRIWSLDEGSDPIREWKHGPPISIVHFSPDGRLLVTSGASGALRVWEWQTERLVTEIPTGTSGAKDARFSPDGTRLVVAAAVPQDGRVRLWDVGSRSIVDQRTDTPYVETIAFSEDGQTIFSGSYGGTVSFWSIPEGTLHEERNPTLGRIGDLEYLKGLPLLAVLAADGCLHVYDTRQHQQIRSLATHTLGSGTLDASADGQYLAVGSGDGTVKLLRTADLAKTEILWHTSHVRAVSFLPDGKRLVAGDGNGSLRIWDVENGEFQTLGDATGREIATVSVQPGGSLIAAAGVGPLVAIWDSAAGQLARELALPAGNVAVVAFSPSGRQLAVATRLDGCFLFDADDWASPPRQIAQGVPPEPEPSTARPAGEPAGDGPEDESGSGDSDESGSGDSDESGSGDSDESESSAGEIEEFASSSRGIAVHALAFAPDGAEVAIAYDDGQLHFVDTGDGTRRAEPPLLLGSAVPWALVYCRSSQLLAVGTETGEIYFVDRASRRVRSLIKGHSTRINALASLQDGKTLVSGARDRELRLWDTETGEMLSTLIGHRRQVFALAVSPAQDTIASGALEGDVRVWRSRTERR